MMPEGFVLAGGRALRMGVDKARIPFPGRRPMALHMVGVLAAACGRVRLVRRARPDPLPWPDVKVLRDQAPDDDAHPLWGVAAALAACDSDRAVIVPVDVPWLRTVDIQMLLRASGGQGAVATDPSGRVQPLVMVLPSSWASRALTFAAEGRSARSFSEGLKPVPLEEGVLRNLNRWQDTGRSGPIRALLDGLPFLDPEQRSRVAAGERMRLANLGILDPQDPVHSTPPLGDTS
jgi:molybdopterin-guanine dinucleotide biosynthesis protein A